MGDVDKAIDTFHTHKAVNHLAHYKILPVWWKQAWPEVNIYPNTVALDQAASHLCFALFPVNKLKGINHGRHLTMKVC